MSRTSACGRYFRQMGLGVALVSLCVAGSTVLAAGAAIEIVHSFAGGADGKFPEAALIEHGVLYGTTANDITTGECGTVFGLTPGGCEDIHLCTDIGGWMPGQVACGRNGRQSVG